MPYAVNSQGQTVWVDDPAQANAVTKDSAAGGQFVAPHADPSNPLDALGDRKVTEAGGGMETILGPAPNGYHWMSDGSLEKDSFGTKLDNMVMSPKGFAAGILGMSALGALTGAGGAAGEFTGAPAADGSGILGGSFYGGAEAGGTGFGNALVSTAPRFSWQSFLTKAAPGAIKGYLKGGIKGALEGGLSGGTGFNPRDVILSNKLGEVSAVDPGMSSPGTGGGGMNWGDFFKHIVGIPTSSDSGGAQVPVGGVMVDSGVGDSSPSVWSKIWHGITDPGNTGKVVGTIGDVASGVEEGRQKGRDSENNFNVSQDRTKLQATQDYENALENRAALELKQKQFQQEYENNAFSNAMRGALGMNMQDVSVGGVPSDVPVIHFAGGARPSAMGAEGRAAAKLLNSKGMSELQTPVAFSQLPAIERFTPSDYKGGNALDTALGVGGIIGKVGDVWNARTQTQNNQDWIAKLRDMVEKQQITPQQAQQAAQAGPSAAGTPIAAKGSNPLPAGTDQMHPVSTTSPYAYWQQILDGANAPQL